MENKGFYAARRASGLTVEDAAIACGITRQTYQLREANPEDFRISELIGLKNNLTDIGEQVLSETINDIFLPSKLR